MPKCEYCGKVIGLPFRCSFCGGRFCPEHRLPEYHSCPNLSRRTSSGVWQTEKEALRVYIEEREGLIASPSAIVTSQKKGPSTVKRTVKILLVLVLMSTLIWQAPALIGPFTPPPDRMTSHKNQTAPPSQTTSLPTRALSIHLEGFTLTQNGTHLIIEDYASRWAPHYSISLKDGTRLFNLVPYKVKDDVVAEYAFVSKGYTKQIYSLDDTFKRLPRGHPTYVFEIYTHDKKYDFTIDFETKKILFGDHSSVKYLPAISTGNTVYDVVFKDFSEDVFQRIKERVFEGFRNDDLLSKVWHLVRWTESNVRYEYSKASSYIYDPLTFVEKKSGVCIDFAVFYASALLAIGFDKVYVLTFDVGGEGHAAVGVKYGDGMLVLEQRLPVMELQDYMQYSEIILGASISPPIYAYKISRAGDDFVIEFFKISQVNYKDSTPLDGITREFAHDVAQRLAQKLGAKVADAALPYSYEYSWVVNLVVLRFYSKIFHNQWIEYVSDIIADHFIKASITPSILTIDDVDSTTLLIRFS